MLARTVSRDRRRTTWRAVRGRRLAVLTLLLLLLGRGSTVLALLLLLRRRCVAPLGWRSTAGRTTGGSGLRGCELRSET